jgi:ribosome-associated heat shock protein Hsp15
MRARATTSADAQAAVGRVRFDKWLWAARFYKTRSLAAEAIDAGQARLNDTRVKPAHAVRIGDVVSVRRQGVEVVADVAQLSERRGSASDAAKLYRENAASIEAREQERLRRAAAAPERPEGRPTKRDRRRLEDWLNEK